MTRAEKPQGGKWGTARKYLPETESSPIINVWSIDRNYRYTFFNENHAKGMKDFWNVDISLGFSVLDYLPDPEYKEYVKRSYDAILQGNSHRNIDNLRTRDRREVYFENFGHPVYDIDRNITGCMLYTIDITDRIRIERELQKTVSLLESIMNSPESLLILSIDREYRYLFFNNAHKEAMKKVWQAEPKIGTCILDILPDPEHRKSVKTFYDRALTGESMTSVSTHVTTEGEKRHYSNISAPIMNPIGEVTGITVFIIDITEQVTAENQIRESLSEKETLLKEIHHRVKNNFQLITSLLELQSGILTDESARQALQDSQSRIATMSLIHTALYRGSNLTKIHIEDYIQTLLDSITDLYASDNKKINIHTDFGKLELRIEQAIPLSLIINELLTNSMKYAFTNKREGNIWLSLEKNSAGFFHLKVKDDGVGLPEGFDIAKSDGLGGQLVEAFTKQLGGKICITSDKGLTVEIAF